MDGSGYRALIRLSSANAGGRTSHLLSILVMMTPHGQRRRTNQTIVDDSGAAVTVSSLLQRTEGIVAVFLVGGWCDSHRRRRLGQLLAFISTTLVSGFQWERT